VRAELVSNPPSTLSPGNGCHFGSGQVSLRQNPHVLYSGRAHLFAVALPNWRAL